VLVKPPSWFVKSMAYTNNFIIIIYNHIYIDCSRSSHLESRFITHNPRATSGLTLLEPPRPRRVLWQTPWALQWCETHLMEDLIGFAYHLDGCEILHHEKDGWKPVNKGMFTIYELVQDFATIHSVMWIWPTEAGMYITNRNAAWVYTKEAQRSKVMFNHQTLEDLRYQNQTGCLVLTTNIWNQTSKK